jgi:hypothetical protein
MPVLPKFDARCGGILILAFIVLMGILPGGICGPKPVAQDIEGRNVAPGSHASGVSSTVPCLFDIDHMGTVPQYLAND